MFNFEIAKAFYIDWLAFRLDWEFRPEDGGPSIMKVSRGRTTLHLSEHYGDGSPGVKLFVDVDDVETLLTELQGRPNVYMRPAVEETQWKARILTVLDPFGNRIVFSETITSDGKAG